MGADSQPASGSYQTELLAVAEALDWPAGVTASPT